MLQEILNFFLPERHVLLTTWVKLASKESEKNLKDRDFKNQVSSNCQSRDLPIKGYSNRGNFT